ncbi:tyrosine-protein phosphatase [Thermobrachium celere]|uniref:tyrosine-protein phosphatase n=1 Tax=Thermobrachium celere TaxID=53422 RepID=UPI0019423605|nr:CpsB/CapC family capsule biosynthesis tyrosine phosphatase [Thermobrachium celere]GFR36690.1 phosphoesterase [Thermobrachium celere]
MIDIHTHLLPNIDDGPKDIDTTIEMIKIYKSQGVDSVIATPHFYPGCFENTRENIGNEVDKLNKIIKEKNIEFEVLPGSEVFATRDTLQYLKEGKIQTLNNSRYILIEFDFKKFPDYGFELIYEIGLLGYRVIIAHPERYYYVIENINFLNNLIDEGCLIQINASSLTGVFGKDVKKTALKIVENGSFNFIATDVHTLNVRGPYLKDALEIIDKINKDYINILSSYNDMLIKNVEICTKLNKIKEKKSLFNIFSKMLR